MRFRQEDFGQKGRLAEVEVWVGSRVPLKGRVLGGVFMRRRGEGWGGDEARVGWRMKGIEGEAEKGKSGFGGGWVWAGGSGMGGGGWSGLLSVCRSWISVGMS